MLSVAQNGAAHVAHAQTVHEHRARRHVVTRFHRAARHKYLIAYIGDDYGGRRHTYAHGKLRMLFLMTVLAVNGHEKLRFEQCVHEFQLFLIGVTRNVHFCQGLVYDLATVTIKVVYDVVNHPLVARYGRRGNNHGIVISETHLAHFVARHAGERAHGLALTARRNDDEVFVVYILYLVDINDEIVRIAQFAYLRRRCRYVYHTATAKRDFALIFYRKIYYLLQAVYVGRERRYYYAAFGIVREYAVERRANRRLAHGRAFALYVGAFAKKEQYAPVAYLGYALKVYDVAVYGRKVHLEIARVEYRSDGRRYRKSAASRNGVRHVYELHLKTAELHRASGLYDVQPDVFHLLFAQFRVHEGESYFRAVNGHVKVFKNVRESAYMVLVPVSEHDAAHTILVRKKISRIGNNEVYSRHIDIGKTRSAVDNYDISSEFKRGHILADLSDAAQKNHLERRRIGIRSMQ